MRATYIIYIIYACVFRVSSHYNVPIEVQLWDSVKSPLNHMVDVTNEFGLKVLYEHNFLNQNNVAFSPYGLTGILVALFEGIDGESSFQLQRTMALPWNRNVLRIGFRDIHRMLKTYFIPEEGFLAGLTLNNDNVTFKEEYRNVLRFYGFDLDQLPKLPPKDENNSGVNATTISNMPEVTSQANPNKEETTPAASVETSSVEPREPTSVASTTASAIVESTIAVANISTSIVEPVAVMNAETSSTTPTSTSQENSENNDATSAMETSSAVPPSVNPEMVSSETLTQSPLTIEPPTEVTSPINSDVEFITTAIPSTAAPELTNEVITLSSAIPTESGEIAPTMSTISPTTESTSEASTSIAEDSPSTTAATETPTTSTLETLLRRKKSILDFIMERSWLDSSPLFEEHLYERPIDLISDASPRFSNDRMFLANGLTNVEVSYMVYDTVLEYTYLPHFKASAIKLPLDNDNYYLLVVLPDYEFELNRLIKQMAQESNLRDIYSSLQPRYVHACVPSFMVKGFVTLTSDLQRLGIRDVFEPRQSDFTPMTAQKGVYVRNVEQAITVTIRKYENKTQVKSRYVLNRHPVRFSATYPFLYFVMDSNVHVSLMAGKLMDPLNTRIL